MPFATTTRSFLFLISSNDLCYYSSFLPLVVMPLLLMAMPLLLATHNPNNEDVKSSHQRCWRQVMRTLRWESH